MLLQKNPKRKEKGQANYIKEKEKGQGVPRTDLDTFGIRCCTKDEGLLVPRNRLTEADFKPPCAAVVKSHGGERQGKGMRYMPREVVVLEVSILY